MVLEDHDENHGYATEKPGMSQNRIGGGDLNSKCKPNASRLSLTVLSLIVSIISIVFISIAIQDTWITISPNKLFKPTVIYKSSKKFFRPQQLQMEIPLQIYI